MRKLHNTSKNANNEGSDFLSFFCIYDIQYR